MLGTKRLGKGRVNVMGHACAKFASLDFIGRKEMTGKRGKPNISFSNLELNKIAHTGALTDFLVGALIIIIRDAVASTSWRNVIKNSFLNLS